MPLKRESIIYCTGICYTHWSYYVLCGTEEEVAVTCDKYWELFEVHFFTFIHF
jgi:hypothetical protein